MCGSRASVNSKPLWEWVRVEKRQQKPGVVPSEQIQVAQDLNKEETTTSSHKGVVRRLGQFC